MKVSEQASQETRYNRIFLERIPKEFCREYALRPSETVHVPDLSSLQYLIEEFIALSATKIAIPKDSDMASAVEYLHPSLNKKVKLVGKKFQLYGKWGVILAPVQEEFQVRLTKTDSPGEYALGVERDVSEELRQAIPTLFFLFRTFVFGLENELQIELDLDSIKQATNTIRRNSQSPETRMNLAHLSGLFEAYEQQNITSLGIVPKAYDENIAIFQELIEDQIYKNISQQSHSLGIPSLLQKAKSNIKRLSKQLITKTPYKQILTLSSKIFTAATGIPAIDSDWAASFLKKKYLPPIITFDKAIHKAHEAWKSSDHQPIAPKGFFSENFIR
jgi:hypothetical protein